MHEELQKYISDFYQRKIQEGFKVNQIIDLFKDGPMVSELRNSGYEISQLRRYGQLVGTRYAIQQAENRSSVLQL